MLFSPFTSFAVHFATRMRGWASMNDIDWISASVDCQTISNHHSYFGVWVMYDDWMAPERPRVAFKCVQGTCKVPHETQESFGMQESLQICISDDFMVITQIFCDQSKFSENRLWTLFWFMMYKAPIMHVQVPKCILDGLYKLYSTYWVLGMSLGVIRGH